LLARQVGDRHRGAVVIRSQAGTLRQLALKPLEAQRSVIRGSDEAGLDPWRDQRDSGAGHRQDLDDAMNEVIEDALDRKIRRHVAGKGAQHLRQVVSWHDQPPRGFAGRCSV
jgi:hypothetical protein